MANAPAQAAALAPITRTTSAPSSVEPWELRFDDLAGFQPQRLRILWVENVLDCRTWRYYCDIKEAMARLHNLCTPLRSLTCFEPWRRFDPQVVVLGPRFTANIAYTDEVVGFNRSRFAELPVLVIQNKMYEATTRELVGNSAIKLEWTRSIGAAAAFTWLTRHREFTRRSRIPHYWMPFGVEISLYGRRSGKVNEQRLDVGFTGASNNKYPLRQAILATIRSMNVTSYLGTWAQTALNRQDNNSWKAMGRDEYAEQIARTKMWVSTTGPDWIVGTRYFEVLASGTTLLLCNRPPAGVWAYDWLFKEGEHVVLFSDMDELRSKIGFYLRNEGERRRIARAAGYMVQQLHSWDTRALFMTKVAQLSINRLLPPLPRVAQELAPQAAVLATARLVPPLSNASYVGCFDLPAGPLAQAFTEMKTRRRLHWFTVDSCQQTCGSKHRHFALKCGGFCSGNGHRRGQCFCGTLPSSALRPAGAPARGLRSAEVCATTCSLLDSRPCGGYHAAAVYRTASLDERAAGGGDLRQRPHLGAVANDRPQSAPRERHGAAMPSRALAADPAGPNATTGLRRVLRIVAKDCGAGFFALMLYAVNQLIWADARGWPASVSFGSHCQDKRPNRYFDLSKGPNMWEYFFEATASPEALADAQPFELGSTALFRLHHLSAASVQTYPHGVHRHLKVPRWHFDEKWHLRMRQRAHAVLVRHVRIKPHIVRRALAFYTDSILSRGPRPLLGLHMRGTDKIRNVGGRIIPPSEYFPLIASFLHCQPDALIYLATDSPSFLQDVRAADFGSRVVVYEALRSERNIFAERNVGSPYQKGEDALVEALLLSCSNFLIKPASALSEFAVYFNPGLNNHTIELQYETGHQPSAAVFAAHFAGSRARARGLHRCSRYLTGEFGSSDPASVVRNESHPPAR